MDEAQQQGVEAAIERAVLITISGNDHAKTKAQAAPFHLFRNGIVTVSCTDLAPGCRYTALECISCSSHQHTHTHSINATAHGATHPCTLLGFATLLPCAAAVSDLLASGGLDGTAGWRVGWHPGANEPSLACTVAILTCSNSLAHSASKPEHNDPHITPAMRGGWVSAAGAPFGCLSPRHFGCCVTTGCLGNSIVPPGSAPTLLLPDLRVHPGMEGAPLTAAGGALLGILGPPLRQPACAVELPIALPMAYIHAAIHAATQAGAPKSTKDAMLSDTPPQSVSHADDNSNARLYTPSVRTHAVVGVLTHAGRWASGIAMANGYVLTVAHLFARHNGAVDVPLRVCVERSGGVQWLPGTLVYRFTGALDLAVVHTDPTSAPCEATLADTVTPGAPLWASGFPVVTPWGRAVPLRPWLMRGVAATVMRDDDERVGMVLSTCSVHPGVSGGALLNAQGAVVGLLTSNTKHDGVGCVPHLNFAIAAAVLLPVFETARGANPDWAALDVQSEGFKKLWKLGPEPEAPSRTKGLRFEAFVRQGARRKQSAL